MTRLPEFETPKFSTQPRVNVLPMEKALWRTRWLFLGALAGASFAQGARGWAHPALTLLFVALLGNLFLIVPLFVTRRYPLWVELGAWVLDVIVPVVWTLSLPSNTQQEAFWFLLYPILVTALRRDWLWGVLLTTFLLVLYPLRSVLALGHAPADLEALVALLRPQAPALIALVVAALIAGPLTVVARRAAANAGAAEYQALLQDRREARAFRMLCAAALALQEDYRAMLGSLSETLCNYLDPETWSCLVLLFDQESEGDLQVVTGWNVRTSDLNLRIAPVPKTLERAIREGRPVALYQQDPSLASIAPLKRAHTVVLLPLQVDFDTYGVLVLASSEQAASNMETVRFLHMLCQVGSLVLHNVQMHQSLQQTHDRVIIEEEEARRQLSRHLHDGPVQTVAAISMQAEYIKTLLRREPDQVPAELDELYEMSKKASHNMRTLLFTLRPVVLAKEGLGAALDHLVTRLRAEANLDIRFENRAQDIRLRAEVEETAFAVLEEALNNARKHAAHAQIVVRLLVDGDFLIGQVEDNGPGFDVTKMMDSYHERTSLGMLNMKERAALINAIWNVDSTPGEGTFVSLAIPLGAK